MQRRRVAAWLSAVPLMVAGSQVAHVFAYSWIYPNAHVRLTELLATGHQYMVGSGYVPLLLGLFGAIEIVAVGWVFAGTVRRSLQRPVPAWAFALLPILGFTVQEIVERWIASSRFPWWVVLQPTFRLGLLLQLPFAFAAFVAARALLRTARTAARFLGGVGQILVLVGACADQPVRACAHRGLAACGQAFISGLPARGPPAEPVLS